MTTAAQVLSPGIGCDRHDVCHLELYSGRRDETSGGGAGVSG